MKQIQLTIILLLSCISSNLLGLDPQVDPRPLLEYIHTYNGTYPTRGGQVLIGGEDTNNPDPGSVFWGQAILDQYDRYGNDTFGITYTKNFPWIHTDAYGWIWIDLEKERNSWDPSGFYGYIASVGNLKINYAAEEITVGWYYFSKLYIEFNTRNNNMHYKQMLYSVKENKYIEVRLTDSRY